MKLWENMLYNFVLKEKETLSVLAVQFGNANILLNTYFYHIFMNNIQEFPNNLEINMTQITILEKEILCESLLLKYLAYINSMEETFNYNLYVNYNDSKNITICVLRDFIENFLVVINKEYYISDYYLEKILNSIDF